MKRLQYRVASDDGAAWAIVQPGRLAGTYDIITSRDGVPDVLWLRTWEAACLYADRFVGERSALTGLEVAG